MRALRPLRAPRNESTDMTLRTATLLALIGTILLTVLLVWDLVFNVLNVLRGLVPLVIILSSLVYAVAAFGMAMFLYAYRRTQA